MVTCCASGGMVICGCSALPLRRHDVAVLVQLELAGAGVGQFAVGLQDLEEAAALNHQIERIVGLRKSALGEDDLVGSGARAQAQLQAGRDRRSAVRRRRRAAARSGTSGPETGRAATCSPPCWRWPDCWRCCRRSFPAPACRWRRCRVLESFALSFCSRTHLGHLLDGLLAHIRCPA